ncbi:MAG: sodium-dependent bicarbonate transport family permease [Hyphomicrobiaceae bacterium]|nr:sodium-dependent bicarbonate transport family permease [Hyphomicrobiaceae bacterium]
MSALDLALANLLSPMVLFFVLGVVATLVRSDLTVPESIAKGLSLYLMLAIGFKGGASVAEHGLDATLLLAVLAGMALSALIPLVAFQLLQLTTGLSRTDAAAVAAHYGSISIVTFLAATQALASSGITFEGYMVAVAAAMETPAIIVALWLAKRGAPVAAGGAGGAAHGSKGMDRETLREVMFNGSIVLLVGSFFIGALTGKAGLAAIAPFIVEPFKGILCLFLLDMGVIAGRGLRDGAKHMSPGLIGFGIYMPLLGGAMGAVAASLVGLSVGGTALMITLAASASYIAVPAALRLALPEARPSIYLPLSLGITFPFNLTIGIPLYVAAALALH